MAISLGMYPIFRQTHIHLVNLTVCHGKWHKMDIEIGDLPIEHGDFPVCDVSFFFSRGYLDSLIVG